MIICFGEKINSFDEKNLKNSENIQEFIPTIANLTSKCVCPKCGANNRFSFHGSYQRNVTIVNENINKNFVVNITRVKCNSCNSTHALLPSFLVPYKITTLASVLTIVSSSLSTTVLKVADVFKISFELIYLYINLVASFFSDTDILNNSKGYISKNNFNKKYYLSNCLQICTNNFKIDYLQFFKWSFLMQKFRNSLSYKIYIGLNFSVPHNI